MTSFSLAGDHNIDFTGPTECQLLEGIDLDDLFAGIHFDMEEMLPELEVDPEFLEGLKLMSPENTTQVRGYSINEDYSAKISEGEDVSSVSVIEPEKKDEKERKNSNSLAKKKVKKNNSNNNNNRKTKVDWTPELHRRFVEAVEKLGVEKAVPSRILELMAIPCLTRHNIASHLQKYRSHRKHLVAREEEARWSQKRQMYGGEVKSNSNCHKPTMGFPQPPHHHHRRHPFQPLHVWGHPTHLLQHQPMMMPQQLVHPYSPHHQYRVASPLVQGIPPPQSTVYKPQLGVVASSSPQSGAHHPPLDSHPTRDSIDKAIGDVLTKPRLPLPIGLKPPSMESVMEDLHRHGIPNIPHSNSTTSHICWIRTDI